MVFKRIFLVVLIVVGVQTVQAQKAKYKDIYVWLANKQYSEAEPFLRRYVRENDDNPSAFLHMGLIYEFNALNNDPLKATRKAFGNLDSALLFFDKASKTITEKELKRNDEYYESFKRRDLRTGEYGVKMSDIQFFLEKKQQEINERIDKLKMVSFYFLLSDSTYKKSQSLFRKIQGQFPTIKHLLLCSTYNSLEELEMLSGRFDSCTKAFDIFKTNLQSLGKTAYNQEIELLEIADLATDGISPADFYLNNVKLWDYKKFADGSLKHIKNDIVPLRDHLVSADIDINRLREKMEKDSVSVKPQLEKLIPKIQADHLLQYDKTPLPLFVFDAKIADLQYRSTLFENSSLRDSANVKLKLTLATAQLAGAKMLDSLVNRMDEGYVEENAKFYDHFINNTYGSATVLKSYISSLKEYAKREHEVRKFEKSFREESVRWLVSPVDSVPLFLNPASRYRHRPLTIIDDKFTSGLIYKDTATVEGYFFTIPVSHKVEVSVTFPLEPGIYSFSKFAATKSFMISDPAGQIFFTIIYSEMPVEGKVHASVAKIYRSDGLAWSSDIKLDAVPTGATFVNGELIVTTADGKNAVLDKNGKMK